MPGLPHLEVGGVEPEMLIAIAVPAVDPPGRAGVKAGAARRLGFQVRQAL
jgi:hypothetical protein